MSDENGSRPSSGRRPARRSGRPAGDEGRDVRAHLLTAARELFARHGFDAVSTRQLARSAGATPAMVHYYFGDKHGLFRALTEETLGPAIASLESLADGGEAASVEQFMEQYIGVFREHPWLPQLVFREMMEGGEDFRSHFAGRFGHRVRGILGSAIRRGQGEGEIDPSLDPDLLTISTLALCVFPFLARPMVETVLGIDIDAGFAGPWQDLAKRLFSRGAAP
jgi:AcrR family transcriptional regulator